MNKETIKKVRALDNELRNSLIILNQISGDVDTWKVVVQPDGYDGFFLLTNLLKKKLVAMLKEHIEKLQEELERL